MNKGYTINQGYPQNNPQYAQNAYSSNNYNPPQYGNTYADPLYGKNEMAQPVNFDTLTRLNFIRKVYGILAVQLLISTVFVLIGTFFINLGELTKTMQSIFSVGIIVSIILSYVMVIAIVCCVGRVYPANYICLFIFTLAESFLLMLVGAQYEPRSVIIALAMTAAATCALSVYALTTKTDFTPWVGVMWMILFGFIVFSILYAIFIRPFASYKFNKTYYFIGCIIGLIIYSIYLIIDTQLMIGKFGLKYEIDDYIIVALNLYLDIINLFLYILRLFGETKN